jgi:hypothetical protein
MDAFTRKLWDKQNQHEGDRERLFTAAARAIEASTVLYPGSFVDIAPSYVFPSVTYVDLDQRAQRFFADEAGVLQLVGDRWVGRPAPTIRFLHQDYREPLALDAGGFDLLVSLYAGFVSEHCTHYLRVGGTLLVNPSHGDAAMASIDDRYQLAGVITSGSGPYRVGRSNLDSYLVPKKEQAITAERLHDLGRGIGYTKSPFAYLFTRVR